MGGIGRMFGKAGRPAVAAGVALLLAGATSGRAQEAGAPMERCFGVSLAGQNEGIGLDGDTAKSTVNYQGDAWSMVPRGTCQTMPLPVQPDGTPRRGAIRPLDRDPG